MAAVAALLVGMASVGVLNSGSDIRGSVAEAICRVATLGNGDCGGPSTATAAQFPADDLPTYRDPSLTPVQKATKGNYVALGDSYSSGEGGLEYEADTDIDKESLEQRYFEGTSDSDPYSNMCHRSTKAYGQRVATKYDFTGVRFTFRACSGALLDDFSTKKSEADTNKPWRGNDGEDAQEDYVDEDTTLITFSIGGNDADFVGTLQACIGGDVKWS